MPTKLPLNRTVSSPRATAANPTANPTVEPLADRDQIDQAIDYAARIAKATVAEFVAAPASQIPGQPTAIEIAIDFFVPPASIEEFTTELDRALIRRSLQYAAARRAQTAAPIRLSVLPPGAFHQWRMIWNVNPVKQHEKRWTPNREILESILTQAQTGWRELQAQG